MKEIEIFVKQLWAAGQQGLETKYHHSKELNHKLDVNPYELLVYSSAACIDLMFWSVKEESGTCLQ